MSAAGRWCASRSSRRWRRRRAPVIVVTGHQRERVSAALQGPPCHLRAQSGFRRRDCRRRSRPASPRCRTKADGAIVCLGDMPQVDAALIDRLLAAFDPEKRRAHRRADGRRQARQSRRVVAAVLSRTAALEGDVGARNLIGSYPGSGRRGSGQRQRPSWSMSIRRTRCGVKAESRAQSWPPRSSAAATLIVGSLRRVSLSRASNKS